MAATAETLTVEGIRAAVDPLARRAGVRGVAVLHRAGLALAARGTDGGDAERAATSAAAAFVAAEASARAVGGSRLDALMWSTPTERTLVLPMGLRHLVVVRADADLADEPAGTAFEASRALRGILPDAL